MRLGRLSPERAIGPRKLEEVHSVQYLESFAQDMAKEAIGMRGGLRHLAKSVPG